MCDLKIGQKSLMSLHQNEALAFLKYLFKEYVLVRLMNNNIYICHYFYTSTFLHAEAPFSRSSNFFVVTDAIVLSCPFQSSHGGAYQERLENYWADDDGQGFVAFQRKHRFDKNTMKDWQDCVRALYPRKKVGLILDRSSIRSC